MATVFGALYVSLLSFIIRLGHAAPAVPAARRWPSSAPSAAGSCCCCSRSGPTTPAPTSSGKNFGRTKFLTHISPSKTFEGLVGGVVATTVVVGVMLWGLGQNPLHALAARAADRARRPGRRPRRIDHQAGGRREGLGDAHPGPRRHARPRGLVPVRRAGRDPVCPRLPPLTEAGQGERPARASPSSARPARSDARRSTSSPRTPTRSASSPWRRARTPGCSPSRPAALRPAAVALGDEAALAGLDLPAGTERVGGPDALETLATRDDVDLVDRRDRRRRQPPAGPRRPARRQGRGDGQQGDARRGRPPRHAARRATWPRAVAATDPGDPYASPLAWLRPIDSEHSAIWQCLVGESMADGRER